MMSSLKQIEFQLFEIMLKLRELTETESVLVPIAERVGECIERIESKRYNIAVIGEFKRGKSSLINAILGMPVLPADVTPTTATINRITFGGKPEVTIRYKNGTEQILDDISSLSNYVTKLSEQQSRVAATVQEAVITYPAIICQNHVDIIDTPGLGDDEEMTDTTISILKQIDAAIVVVSALSPFDVAETDLVVKLIDNREITNVVFVINFMDQIDVDERDAVFCSIRSRIIKNTTKLAQKRFVDRPELLNKTHRIIDDPQIFPLSAKKALKSFAANDVTMLKESGVSDFKSKILSIITREQCVNSAQKSVYILRDAAEIIDRHYVTMKNATEKKLQDDISKRDAINKFILEAPKLADDILFSLLDETPRFDSQKVCDDLLQDYIKALSTITTRDTRHIIRLKIDIATQNAVIKINKQLEKYRNICMSNTVKAGRIFMQQFPLPPPGEFNFECLLKQKMDRIWWRDFITISTDNLLPTFGNLQNMDLSSHIRRKLQRTLRCHEEAFEKYCCLQRVSFFRTVDEFVSKLKELQRIDIEAVVDSELCKIEDWHMQMASQTTHLLDKAEAILKEVLQ